MSGLQALPSRKYPDVQPAAPATPASRARRRGSMAGVCIVATLLLVVPLFTLEADARGGGGGHGGGFGGHGGGFGGRGGVGVAPRGGGVGGGGSPRGAAVGGGRGGAPALPRPARL